MTGPQGPRGVSTHSRLKAAGPQFCLRCARFGCFNTQPPKGGWLVIDLAPWCYHCFNTQPPKGGWNIPMATIEKRNGFNTQPPKGGWETARRMVEMLSGFNTQPPKGGWRGQCDDVARRMVSTHSRLKAAGKVSLLHVNWTMCFNTQPPKGGWVWRTSLDERVRVSTHSRLKAAGSQSRNKARQQAAFQHTAA